MDKEKIINSKLPLDAQIEAVLFWKGEPVSGKKLAHILNVSTEEVADGILELEKKLEKRGLTLVYKDDEIMLGTSELVSGLIEELTREEYSRDLGKAGAETLSIVLYKGPITRREIDYIRGVNSTFILRNLMVRGLVEKIPHEKDLRMFLYRPTFELLAHLGVKKIEDLPEYNEVRLELEKLAGNEEKEEPVATTDA